MTEIYVVLHTHTFAFHYFHVHLSLTKWFCTKRKPFLQFGGNFFLHVQTQNLATITEKLSSLYISTEELHYNHLPRRRRRPEVKFSSANLLGMRKVVKMASSLRRRRNSGRLSLKRKYKTIPFASKSLFFPPCHSGQVEIYSLWISRIQMLSTLSISSPT